MLRRILNAISESSNEKYDSKIFTKLVALYIKHGFDEEDARTMSAMGITMADDSFRSFRTSECISILAAILYFYQSVADDLKNHELTSDKRHGLSQLRTTLHVLAENNIDGLTSTVKRSHEVDAIKALAQKVGIAEDNKKSFFREFSTVFILKQLENINKSAKDIHFSEQSSTFYAYVLGVSSCVRDIVEDEDEINKVEVTFNYIIEIMSRMMPSSFMSEVITIFSDIANHLPDDDEPSDLKDAYMHGYEDIAKVNAGHEYNGSLGSILSS